MYSIHCILFRIDQKKSRLQTKFILMRIEPNEHNRNSIFNDLMHIHMCARINTNGIPKQCEPLLNFNIYTDRKHRIKTV